MAVEERIRWVDMAKGYGILLVILGHLETHLIKYEIFTFHMPLFFFLAGYVFAPDKYTLKDFIRNKARTLLVPYFFMGSIICVCMWLFHGYFTLRDLFDCFLKLLVQRRFETLWFLTCLFFTQLLYWALHRLCGRNRKYILAVSLFLWMSGIAYYHFGGAALPWNLDACLTAVFYLALGNYVRSLCGNCRWMRLVHSKITLFSAILLHICCTMGNGILCGERFDMFYGQYGIPPVTLVAALTGIFLVYRVSAAEEFRYISYLGRNSLLYFGLHQALPISLLEQIYSRLHLFQDPSGAELFPYLSISMAFVLLSLAPVDLLIRKTRLCFFLGRKS